MTDDGGAGNGLMAGGKKNFALLPSPGGMGFCVRERVIKIMNINGFISNF